VADSLEKMIKTDSGNKIPFLIKALTQIEGIRFLPFLETYSDHPEGRVRRATAESLTFIRGAKALSLARDLLSDPDPTVRTATITSLAQHGSPAGEFLTSSLNDSDWAVRTSAIEGIKVLNRASQFQNLENAFKSKFDRTEAEESNALLTAMFALDEEKTIPYLFSALNSVHYPLRASARELLHQAGQTLPPDPTPDFNSYPPDFGKSLGPQFICIITAKGRIEVELFGDDAPLVAGNMLKLIRQGFYKDLVLHRVVPDFVIQSGDPRGDGWGGPGFSIRDQVNRRKFLTGTMGLPISQKDTGGSQFFICLSPQPHLDGNYTAFGQVVKGIEILSDLSEGDSILEINLSLKDNTKPKYRQL
jgi:cyclophilin family peptidyl-prolyl cis-trans isomerase